MSNPPEISQAIKLFLQLLRLIKPFHKHIINGVLIGPAIGLLSIAPPYFTKLLFDKVANNYDLTLMTLLVTGIVAFSIAAIIAEAILHYYSSYLNIKLENTIQLLFFNHIQHLPFSFFYQRQVGEISSRFHEIKSALGSVYAFLNITIGQGIYLLIVPPFLFYLNWKLALVALVTVPLSAITIYWMSKKLRTSWQQVVESHASVEASQLEMLNQIATVKVLQLEQPLYDKTSHQLTKVLDAHMRAQGLSVSLSIFDRAINVLTLGLFTWLGWRFILKGEMSLGDYVAFVAYVGYLRNPAMDMINLFTNFQQWAIHLHRIFEYLNLSPEQIPLSAAKTSPLKKRKLLSHKLQIKNLGHDYALKKKALDTISMDVLAGNIIALIGTSGSGKSTLLRLLTRMEQGHTGEILLDETPIENIPLAELRAYLGVVWQDVELFQGTIRENLTIGTNNIEQEWLDYIVERCCLTELIDSLPQGYDTQVAERGLSLSGGQRQRIALARALVRHPPILLLDEAMSNLDVETEARIALNLFEHARNYKQTVMFVTHRVAAASLADHIYLFEDGKIAAHGTHQHLLDNSISYQRLLRLNEDISAYA